MKIRTSGFNAWYIVILISLLIVAISLIIPWFSLGYNNNSYSAFSSIIGITWLISVIMIIINTFLIFSTSLKQKIKLQMNSSWKDSSIFLASSIIILILWIQSFVSLTWLKIFSSDVTFHSWITFYLIGSILFVWGSILNKSLSKKLWETYITNNSNTDSSHIQKIEKNTTKLPF